MYDKSFFVAKSTICEENRQETGHSPKTVRKPPVGRLPHSFILYFPCRFFAKAAFFLGDIFPFCTGWRAVGVLRLSHQRRMARLRHLPYAHKRGTMYVLEDGGVKAECVVTDEGGRILELKNLAVKPEAQRKGYGKNVRPLIKSSPTSPHQPKTNHHS